MENKREEKSLHVRLAPRSENVATVPRIMSTAAPLKGHPRIDRRPQAESHLVESKDEKEELSLRVIKQRLEEAVAESKRVSLSSRSYHETLDSFGPLDPRDLASAVLLSSPPHPSTTDQETSGAGDKEDDAWEDALLNFIQSGEEEELYRTTGADQSKKPKRDRDLPGESSSTKKFKPCWPSHHLPPPKLGQKELPRGQPDCLRGLNFVCTGVLESLEKESAKKLITEYGGMVCGTRRVTTAVSGKTHYLVAGSHAGESKLAKAHSKGTTIIDEDQLFELIRTRQPEDESVSNKKETKSKRPKKKKEIPLDSESLTTSSTPRLLSV